MSALRTMTVYQSDSTVWGLLELNLKDMGITFTRESILHNGIASYLYTWSVPVR